MKRHVSACELTCELLCCFVCISANVLVPIMRSWNCQSALLITTLSMHSMHCCTIMCLRGACSICM